MWRQVARVDDPPVVRYSFSVWTLDTPQAEVSVPMAASFEHHVIELDAGVPFESWVRERWPYETHRVELDHVSGVFRGLVG